MIQGTPTTPTTTQSEVLDFLKTTYQLDPVSLRRIFLLLLRNHYSDPGAHFGLVPDAFKTFKYADDPSDRVVDIDLDYLYAQHTMGRVPAIYVGLDDVAFGNVNVLDQYAGASDDRATQSYADTARTHLIALHRAKTPDEALSMGVVTFGFLNGIRQLLQARLGLHSFLVTGLTKPVTVKGEDGSNEKEYSVRVNAHLSFSSDWSTNVESHRIKKISFDPRVNS